MKYTASCHSFQGAHGVAILKREEESGIYFTNSKILFWFLSIYLEVLEHIFKQFHCYCVTDCIQDEIYFNLIVVYNLNRI